MLRNIIICSSIFLSISCATAADIAIQTVSGAVGGALGNMADRRMEKALGNNVEEMDKKLEPILKEEKEFTVVDENDKEIK
tara:strand:+ start:146 stop:388 length:243 start_codon:yes stop_codon:yes gene_type:complete